jgi:hypothetical protein
MTRPLMTFFILSLLAFSCHEKAYAAQKVIEGTGELPLEVTLLISHVQNGKPQNFESILTIAKNIDAYARSMSKEDIFLLGKVEIYKALLKNYSAPIRYPVDGVSLEILRDGINKTNDNFLKWFLQALLKDTTDLISSPAYKEFLLQKNSTTKLEKTQYRKVEKKAQLLQYWISKIHPQAEDYPEGLKTALAPHLDQALNNIQNSFYLMAKEVSQKPMSTAVKNIEELKFFRVVDSKPTIFKPSLPTEKTKSVEDILAPLTEIFAPDLPAPSQEKWLEEENTPPALQNLPKPNNDADWLQDF